MKSYLERARETNRVEASLVLVLVRLRELLEDGRDDLIREEASRCQGLDRKLDRPPVRAHYYVARTHFARTAPVIGECVTERAGAVAGLSVPLRESAMQVR